MTSYPRCTRCKQMFTPRALLEGGMCHDCNQTLHWTDWFKLAAIVCATAAVILMTGCSDQPETHTVKFRPIIGWNEYQVFTEENHVN